MTRTPAEPWHLDKRVPLALIVTILLQTGTAVWFLASLQSRMGVVERDLGRERDLNGRQEVAIRAIETGAARLDQKLDGILDVVERMDRRLERMERLGSGP
jgi:hypothetical protein